MMADFINTVDILGDDAVTDAIIQRSITEFYDDKVVVLGDSAFAGCTELSDVCFPNVTSFHQLSYGVFEGSGILRITPDIFPKVTELGYVYTTGHFKDCVRLESVDWPSLQKIDTNNLFRGCTSLKTVNLPNLETISGYGDNIFLDCRGLSDINLPKLTSVKTSFFCGCKSLENITLPSVTSCVGSNIFRESGIIWIDLPVCTTFGGSFVCGYNYTTVALFLRSPTICSLTSNNAFTNSKFTEGTAYIYVPSVLIEDYKVATNWSVFADQFRAIEDYTVDGTLDGPIDETKI